MKQPLTYIRCNTSIYIEGYSHFHRGQDYFNKNTFNKYTRFLRTLRASQDVKPSLRYLPFSSLIYFSLLFPILFLLTLSFFYLSYFSLSILLPIPFPIPFPFLFSFLSTFLIFKRKNKIGKKGKEKKVKSRKRKEREKEKGKGELGKGK